MVRVGSEEKNNFLTVDHIGIAQCTVLIVESTQSVNDVHTVHYYRYYTIVFAKVTITIFLMYWNLIGVTLFFH